MGRSARVLASLVSVATALVINQVGAFADSGGKIGYDISYPQCGGSYPSGKFGIVGVDSGFPFMSLAHPGNPCLASEYAHALPHAALYVNTGYDPSYTNIDGRHTTIGCATRSTSVSGTSDQQAAWAVGCSEASRDVSYANAQGATDPAGWWLDVETANSWCSPPPPGCTDLTLNQYTIQGIVDTLRVLRAHPNVSIGIYSNTSNWSAIVGSLKIRHVSSDWVATGTGSAIEAARFCKRKGFSGAPVRLVQYVTTFDFDYACKYDAPDSAIGP